MSGLSCGLPPPALCALPLYVFPETESRRRCDWLLWTVGAPCPIGIYDIVDNKGWVGVGVELARSLPHRTTVIKWCTSFVNLAPLQQL